MTGSGEVMRRGQSGYSAADDGYVACVCHFQIPVTILTERVRRVSSFIATL
jgi:hypothetical protein